MLDVIPFSSSHFNWGWVRAVATITNLKVKEFLVYGLRWLDLRMACRRDQTAAKEHARSARTQARTRTTAFLKGGSIEFSSNETDSRLAEPDDENVLDIAFSIFAIVPVLVRS